MIPPSKNNPPSQRRPKAPPNSPTTTPPRSEPSSPRPTGTADPDANGPAAPEAVIKIDAIPLDHPMRQRFAPLTVLQVHGMPSPPSSGNAQATPVTPPLGHIATAEENEAAQARLVDEMLRDWPLSSPPAEPQNEGAQRAAASAVVALPWLWEQLPDELQQLVLDALFAHADQVSHSDEAAAMRQDFAHLLQVSKPLCTLTLKHRDRVLFCALRLAPMSQRQLLDTPLHRLLGHGSTATHAAHTPATYALIHTLRALAAATARLPTDEQARHAVLELGWRLLAVHNSPQATAQDRRALLLMPLFMVQALRARLHRARQPCEAIANLLRELARWAQAREPSLAVPLLLELLYTVNQLSVFEKTKLIQAYDVARFAEHLEMQIAPRLDPHGPPLINTVDLIVYLLPDPWGVQRTPSVDPEELTRALAFLASYPYDFVGFVSEALTSLIALAPDLDEQQAQLMQRCLDRQAKPLQRPRPATNH